MKWRVVPGWPNYEVSERGDVRRVCDGTLRKPYLTDNTPSYLYLVLRNGPKVRRAISIHRIVALAFLGLPPFPGAVVAHRDGNYVNNYWRNLKWATRSENEMDKVAHGRSNRGQRQHMSKLNPDQVREIRALYRKLPRSKIAARFGVHEGSIQAIGERRSWYWLP